MIRLADLLRRIAARLIVCADRIDQPTGTVDTTLRWDDRDQVELGRQLARMVLEADAGDPCERVRTIPTPADRAMPEGDDAA